MLDWLNANAGLITLIVGIITVFAIYRAPIVALRLQKQVEVASDKKERKLAIFKTLMATRSKMLSSEHVQALNMIDIEFYDEKNIRDAWDIYRDHLGSRPKTQDKTEHDRWGEKCIDCLIDLLYIMSKHFGYDFNKVILKKGAYSPEAHGVIDFEHSIIRRGFASILTGDSCLNVKVSNIERPIISKKIDENA